MQPIFDIPKQQRDRGHYRGHPLMDQIYEGIMDHLTCIPQAFTRALVIDPYDHKMEQYLSKTGLSVSVGADPLDQMRGDELPFPPGTFDLIIDVMNLQNINDIPRYLKNMHTLLTDEGIFMGAFPGGNSLFQLRQSFLEADMELNRISPHIAPMIELQTAGQLLQQAGFRNPVIDQDAYNKTYLHLQDLWQDIRAMGQGNSLKDRFKGSFTPSYQMAIEKKYQDLFKEIQATVEILYITGWK